MRAVRLATVFSLALAGTLLGAPAGAAAAPTASCAFPRRFPTLDRGTVLGLDFSFRNTGDADATFTAVMLANDFFGPRHTFLTRTVGAGLGTAVSAHVATSAAPHGTDDLTIEITSSATGSTVLASCTTRLTLSPDTDRDGLLDVWESTGIDGNDDHIPDIVLAGANPRRRDVYLEVDHMTDHVLRPEARQDVITAFAGAPVRNPDGSSGITLHIDEDEELAHQENVNTWGDFDAIKRASFGTPAQRAGSGTVAAKRMAYHYALFAHRRDDSGSSGRAEIHGNDMLVTLGSAGWGLNAAGTHRIGTREEQAGTLMHELGHNLGLDHGGDTSVNCKPNYLSVMSYTFQTGLIPQAGGGRALDYSRRKLINLGERSLVEQDGVGDGGANFTFWSSDGGAGGWSTGQANSRLDWNENGATDAGTVSADVNNLGIADCGSSPAETLTGYNDWANVDLNFRDDADYADGAHTPTPQELDDTTAKAIGGKLDAALSPETEAGGPYTSTENTPVRFKGSATDPDSATLTYAWDFGDGTTGTGASPTHAYGDDGTFTATLTVTDGNGRSDHDSTTVTVSNTAPTARIIRSGPFVGRRDTPVQLTARSTDPGSDDLAITWTWGDGGTTATDHLVNPPARDPFPSPEVRSRTVTDTRRHTFSAPCPHSVRLTSADDDGGTATATATLVVTGDSLLRHPTAYWAGQYNPPQVTPALLCYLRTAAHLSTVFNKTTDVSTRDRAFGVLASPSPNLRQRLDAQLLTAWLNFADGAPGLHELVDTNFDLLPDTRFSTAMARAEAARLDPAAGTSTLLAQLRTLNWINLGH
ncbi:PKD domain-containing protein [Nonomuraea sp. NPDC046570]|uniref:PKD domain-containing protein n=1 Tax=Nonomuraea sp. NPDC046570 TaxID=3155255 RepID=UPI003408C38E